MHMSQHMILVSLDQIAAKAQVSLLIPARIKIAFIAHKE